MKILFCGKFDPEYNRTKIIIDGLRSIPGLELEFYNYHEHGSNSFIKLRKACRRADVVFLPSFTHKNILMVKLLAGKPIIFDPLISRYLTKIIDYKQAKEGSFSAFKYRLKDRFSMGLADIVLCDTHSHLQYFNEVIGVPIHKLNVLPVGVNNHEFKPQSIRESDNKKFIVGFYGSFVPLQGAACIIDTANLLKDDHSIQFRLIGDGMEYENVKRYALEELKLSNIEFCGWMDYDKLHIEISAFDICLGIFGESKKADVVIPNKIYHYAAMQKAIITKDTIAVKEIFSHNRDIILCANEPHEISRWILLLKNDPGLLERIGHAGFKTITTGYNHVEIGKKWLSIAQELLS
jgi:glycosyltransferase involved in cell wall biosynthesis